VADRLAVDLDALDTLATSLDSIRTRMNATRTVLDSFRGEMGSAEVENALSDFEGGWKDGRKKIDRNTQTLATMARESARVIRKADNDLRDKLTERPEGASGGPVRAV
jgi:hypothetical protein